MTAKMAFETWKRFVDRAIEERTGLDSEGLPDYDYWKAWFSGKSADATAAAAIRAAKNY